MADWVDAVDGVISTMRKPGFTYRVGNDGLDGSPIYAEFITDTEAETVPLWRGQECLGIDNAKRVCELHYAQYVQGLKR